LGKGLFKNMDIKVLVGTLKEIAEERGIPFERVLESLEQALASAYKKEYGKKGQIIKCKIDLKKGSFSFWQIKKVVTEDMILKDKEEPKEGEEKIKFNPEKHILLEEAKKINKEIKAGEDLILPLKEEKEFSRIAAQTAKQVILQKIKEVEKETTFKEYKEKEDKVVMGVVQKVDKKNVLVNVGKVIGILPKEEQVPGEFYRPGQRMKVYIKKVELTSKGPMIILSRAYPKLVSRLFEAEVPEIQQGIIQIESIAREPGSRTKIAVSSKKKEIDPVGAVVGHRGTRVQVVINELGGEKIDVIEYSEDPSKYIANSLSPAKVVEVKILPKNIAKVFVLPEQLSLAIGKDGQNVRLASKLTNWRIEVEALKPQLEEKEKK
jgi:N utilization substance protein A